MFNSFLRCLIRFPIIEKSNIEFPSYECILSKEVFHKKNVIQNNSAIHYVTKIDYSVTDYFLGHRFQNSTKLWTNAFV